MKVKFLSEAFQNLPCSSRVMRMLFDNGTQYRDKKESLPNGFETKATWKKQTKADDTKYSYIMFVAFPIRSSFVALLYRSRLILPSRCHAFLLAKITRRRDTSDLNSKVHCTQWCLSSTMQCQKGTYMLHAWSTSTKILADFSMLRSPSVFMPPRVEFKDRSALQIRFVDSGRSLNSIWPGIHVWNSRGFDIGEKNRLRQFSCSRGLSWRIDRVQCILKLIEFDRSLNSTSISASRIFVACVFM